MVLVVIVVLVVVVAGVVFYLSIYLPTYLSIYLSICLSASLKTQLFCEMSSIFELDNTKNAAILRDFLNFWTWQHQKRNKSARFPQLVDNIKLRDFLQKLTVECRAGGLVPMRFAIFPLHLSKLLRLPRKSDARSYEVLHLSRGIISANLKIWCSKMLPLYIYIYILKAPVLYILYMRIYSTHIIYAHMLKYRKRG